MRSQSRKIRSAIRARAGDPQSKKVTDRANRAEVVYTPVAELKLDLRNPRQHSPQQIRQIARSIEAFGFNVPVLVDAERKIIAGHGRVLAARALALDEVPTI